MLANDRLVFEGIYLFELFLGIAFITGIILGTARVVFVTILAIAANFGFGILLNFGVGNYAPTLVILSLMGMDPKYCFPIMATGASLMGAGAGVRHIHVRQIDLRVVLGLALGGIPGVLVAAFLVKSMSLEMLRWLVIVVVLYAAAVMSRAAWKGRREHKAEAATAPVAA